MNTLYIKCVYDIYIYVYVYVYIICVSTSFRRTIYLPTWESGVQLALSSDVEVEGGDVLQDLVSIIHIFSCIYKLHNYLVPALSTNPLLCINVLQRTVKVL